MGTQRICSVDGCGKAVNCRNLCLNHYESARRRGTIATIQTPRGAGLRFLNQAIAENTEECILWPYAKGDHGYGSVTVNGKRVSTHRYACEAAHGKPPAGHQACHLCGVRACVNPRHLHWGTQSQNEIEKAMHGRDMRGEKSHLAKLTTADVLEIRASAASASEIASQFGLTRDYVKQLRTGRRWAHIPGAHRRTRAGRAI
jgi:hypothetical protein